MRQIILLFLPLILLSCGEPTIDASSEQAMESSIENIKGTLTEDKENKFKEALMTIATDNLDFSKILKSSFQQENYSENFLERIKDQIDGKTANQIISIADSITRARKLKQKRQALKEIKELEQKLRVAQEDKKHLAKFKVLYSKFYKTESYFTKDPTIELRVRNGTKYAISRAYFDATYASLDRQIPWLEDSFNYQISGGIEPGEEKTWTLAPNMFGEWGNIEVKKDGILTVEVVRLDGPNGEALFDAQGLSEYEKERLKQLKKEYSIE